MHRGQKSYTPFHLAECNGSNSLVRTLNKGRVFPVMSYEICIGGNCCSEEPSDAQGCKSGPMKQVEISQRLFPKI